jgi:hypothetical protein
MISSCSPVEGEGVGSLAKDGVGAVVEGVERGTMLLRQTQMRWALRSVGSSLGSRRHKLRQGKENAGASKDFIHFFEIVNRNFISLHKFIQIHNSGWYAVVW